MKIEKLLNNSGHKSLLPLQEATIAAFKKNNHVRLLAQTGSGKTLAFLLGTLQHLSDNQRETQAIVITPTRELTLQVASVFKSLRSGITHATCYGGHPVKIEKNELRAKPAVIFATPGRLLDHLKRDHVDLSQCSLVIIDEFDKCLEFGFEKEMEAIRSYLAKEVKTLFVSATPIEYTPTSWSFDTTVSVAFDFETKPQGLQLWRVNCDDTFEGMRSCINTFRKEPTIVFCNYREVVDDVTDRLSDSGISCIGYHGGMDQNARELALLKFKNGSALHLVCTDLGARGLDIEEIQHIIHYQFPESEAAFTHRNGRTARAKNTGNAYILYKNDQSLPDYLQLPEDNFTPNWKSHPTQAEWTTLYFKAGKKDKLRKLDIVGFLSKEGRLQQDQIGKIDLLDHSAFAAIQSRSLKQTLSNIHMKRIKGKRIVIKKAK